MAPTAAVATAAAPDVAAPLSISRVDAIAVALPLKKPVVMAGGPAVFFMEPPSPLERLYP